MKADDLISNRLHESINQDLAKHGWKLTGRDRDYQVYTHQKYGSHTIHYAGTKNWIHQDSTGEIGMSSPNDPKAKSISNHLADFAKSYDPATQKWNDD